MSELEKFYADLVRGVSVGELRSRFPELLNLLHKTGATRDIRLARGRLKRLRDEVAPALALARRIASDTDTIQFPLDSGPIDCRVYSGDGAVRRIQITIAQARERLNLMNELENKGIGRGYLGLTDDRPTREFQNAMDRGRAMYSTVGAQKTLCSAIELCLKKKSKSRGANVLLIEAPLNILPQRRIDEINPTLVELAKDSPFDEVYVVGSGECRENLYQIKMTMPPRERCLL